MKNLRYYIVSEHTGLAISGKNITVVLADSIGFYLSRQSIIKGIGVWNGIHFTIGKLASYEDAIFYNSRSNIPNFWTKNGKFWIYYYCGSGFAMTISERVLVN